MSALSDLLALSLRSLRHPETALAAAVSATAAELRAAAVAAYLVSPEDGVELLDAGGADGALIGQPGKVTGPAAAAIAAVSARTAPGTVSAAAVATGWSGPNDFHAVATLLGEGRSSVLVVGGPATVDGSLFAEAAACVALLTHVIVQERTLVALRHDALHARQDQSLLRASLHHDLRTPLTGILGAARTLLIHADRLRGDQQRSLLESLVRQGERLSRMVNDALHEPARDGPAREQRVNLRLLAERVASAAALGSRGNVVVEAPDEWAVTDPDRLERALLNLLDNALKYTPEDAPVHLIVVREGDRLSLTVADRGPGVSPDILPRMFTPYTTDPSRSDGTGLGLNSVKRLVQDIGGQISYSRFRDWTRFTITLPDLEEAKA